ncbi:hypothetical protein MtrunA17_Chr1g0160641 [Medicago truncatula]|uniref:Transmembrane protein n=1 Tax=Medicago truncatula TaxID=3880 RepID=A0A396JP45_MEDTR|nr:hypothetical protein MtrunA17_Chr1g0160641 [Medicago truncatula]
MVLVDPILGFLWTTFGLGIGRCGLGWLYFWATRDFLLIAIFCLEFVFSLCLYSIERIQFELVIKKIQSELTEKKINVKTIVIKRKRTMSIICFLFLF